MSDWGNLMHKLTVEMGLPKNFENPKFLPRSFPALESAV